METKEKECNSKGQARAQYESIKEMIGALLNSNDDTRDDAEQTIQEDALSVEVKSDWHTPGDNENSKATEYNILLCTGGPAVRIIGDLNEYLEPETAQIEHQDWFTAWEQYPLTNEEQGTLLVYARCFWFGE